MLLSPARDMEKKNVKAVLLIAHLGCYLSTSEGLILSPMIGKEIRVACPTGSIYPLFSITMINGSRVYGGAEVDLLKYMAKALNFKIRMLPSVDGQFGVLTNGTWNGIIGMLQRKEVDVAIGSLSITPERSQVVSPSWPVLHNTFCLVSHVPELLPKWQAIAWPFQKWTWLAILGTMPVFGIILWVLFRIAWTTGHFSLSESFLFVISSILGQGVSFIPNVDSIQLAILFWSVYCFILDATFSSSLVSYLTLPKQSMPLDTFQQLADLPNYNILFMNGSYHDSILKQYKDPVFKKIVKKWEQQKKKFYSFNPGHALDILMTDPNFVTFNPTIQVEATRDIFLSLKSGATFVHLSTEQLVNANALPLLPKGSPYQETFRKYIRRAWYFGLIDKWKKDSIAQGKAQTGSEEQSKDPQRIATLNYIKALEEKKGGSDVLSLGSIQGPFYILIIGLAAAMITFCLELAASKSSRTGIIVQVKQTTPGWFWEQQN